MPKNWYVINTNPRCESIVERQLQTTGIEVFLPRIIEYRTRKPRLLFPGYIFVNLDFGQVQMSTICFMHGVRRFLCLEDGPIPVDNGLIAYVKRQCQKREAPALKASFQVGDKVRFLTGAFQGIEGIFSGEVSGRDRVKILIDSICLVSKIEVLIGDVKKVS